MSYTEDRIEHCWQLVTHLHPCPCGYNTVEIEPCQITCPHCGRFRANVNWDDACASWNRSIKMPVGFFRYMMTPPEVEGWV